MKTLILLAVLLSGCTLPQVIYVDGGYRDYDRPIAGYSFPLVNPLPQHGSSMSFMCRNALNQGDSGAAFIFC
jgi:hypothetical protein